MGKNPSNQPGFLFFLVEKKEEGIGKKELLINRVYRQNLVMGKNPSNQPGFLFFLVEKKEEGIGKKELLINRVYRQNLVMGKNPSNQPGFLFGCVRIIPIPKNNAVLTQDFSY